MPDLPSNDSSFFLFSVPVHLTLGEVPYNEVLCIVMKHFISHSRHRFSNAIARKGTDVFLVWMLDHGESCTDQKRIFQSK